MTDLFLVGFEGIFMLFLSSTLTLMIRKIFELSNIVKEVQSQVREIEKKMGQIAEYKVKK